jgi:Activator of osmoprotectant transporter ProP
MPEQELQAPTAQPPLPVQDMAGMPEAAQTSKADAAPEGPAAPETRSNAGAQVPMAQPDMLQATVPGEEAAAQRQGRARHRRRKPAGRTGAGTPAQAPQARASADGPAQAAALSSTSAPGQQAATRTPRRTHPVLEQLAALYPQLFGAVFRPLKRGIFQDLTAAHPDAFDRAALKEALGLHTRSTRYLHSVAAGGKRYDLAGQPVEDLAPEHVLHALLEVHRRRQARAGADAAATADAKDQLRRRMVAAFEASGLTREAYIERVRSRDEAANALLEEALAEWAARNAKDEALLRAFEASACQPGQRRRANARNPAPRRSAVCRDVRARAAQRHAGAHARTPRPKSQSGLAARCSSPF